MITINPRISANGGEWDDMRRPASADNINSASTRYRFDHAEGDIEFDDDARIANERIIYSFQMGHEWLEGSIIKPHFHWWQASASMPNWYMESRIFNNAVARPSSWVPAIVASNAFDYTSGEIMQISVFPDIDMSSISISGFIEVRFGRDTGNASTEFSGPDPLVGGALFKEFDIHALFDSNGSKGLFTKHRY